MHPILFSVGSWPVYSYGVLLALAYLAGLQFAVRRAKHAGIDGAKMMDFGIYIIISGARRREVDADRRGLRLLPAPAARAACRSCARAACLSQLITGVSRGVSCFVRRYQVPRVDHVPT